MYDISIIIPTYNVENLINEALNSIANQTFKGSIEIIVIDDCSTDGTIKMVEEFQRNFDAFSIKLLIQEKNMRQGTARNKGVNFANGKYIFFLDGDDFLNKKTLEHMFNKAEKENCDFVLCDWVFYYQNKGLVYTNNDLFLTNEILIGSDCERLLEANTYFTVNKLYKRSFLLENKIEYGEGYIYEDFEFYMEVAQKANKISIIHNPYYRVRVNPNSTTQSNRNTTLHIDSLILAITNTLKKFEPRNEHSYYHLYRYLIKKTMEYLHYRAPLGHKRKVLKKVLKLLNDKSVNYAIPSDIPPLFHFYFKRKYVQNFKIEKIIATDFLHRMKVLNFSFKLVSHSRNYFSKGVKLIKRKVKNKFKLKSVFTQSLAEKDMILFLGFDFKYVGNSKYLFDFIVKNNKENNRIYFVTSDKNVPEKYRIEPNSNRFYLLLKKSKVVIAESWIPLDFEKQRNQKWIQLWHGTPFKKMLFDSHETYISSFYPNHKRNKHADIIRWDFLLADSLIAKEKFASSFLLEEEKILPYGYPRVQWLRDNKNNLELLKKIKNDLGILPNQKVILYVPTWRDYNFKTPIADFSHILDLNKLSDSLGEDYIIINKGHSFINNLINSNKVINFPSNMDVQPLILISDIIISDYSSIIFDAMAIDKPFYLYVNDFDKYINARGIYEDMSEKLSTFYVNEEVDLINKLVNISSYPHSAFNSLKDEYTSSFVSNSYDLIYQKIKLIQE